MDETKDLTTLAQTYPDPSRGIRALVLREYEKIQTARRRGWTWPEIATGIGKAGQARSVSTAFSRVKKRVLAGDLEPQKSKAASQTGKATTTSATTSSTGEVDTDSGFRTPATPKKEVGADDDRKWL